MEQGTIEREIAIEASPEVVYEVISSPEHIREWWNGADTDITADAGSVGTIVWPGEPSDDHTEQITVVEAQPFSRFAFRWVYDAGTAPTPSSSLLVVFELRQVGGGTVLRMTETGFRERGWAEAVADECYADHVQGWDRFVPAIRDYTEQLVAA